MNKMPLKSLEALCQCGERTPFNHEILETKIHCINCSKEIVISYCSLSNSNTRALRKIGYKFESILKNGTKKDFNKIFETRLDPKVKILEENKEVYFFLGVGPYDIRKVEGFCNYYNNYKNPSFPMCVVKNHPSLPGIDDIFEISIDNNLNYYLLCYRVPFYADGGFGDKYDFPDVEFFVNFLLKDDDFVLLDGKLNWVTLHPEFGPFEPKSTKALVQLSKKNIKSIKEEFGEEVANIFEPFETKSIPNGTNFLTQEQLDKEIKYYKLDDKKDKIKEITSGGPCFIATATYGGHDHPKVKPFIEYRDNYLSNSAFGRTFINIYYKVSPIISRLIINNYQLKKLANFFLDKVGYVIAKKINEK
jgi:hypothetical protein